MKFSKEEYEGGSITMENNTWEYVISDIKNNECTITPIRAPSHYRGQINRPEKNYSITIIQDEVNKGRWQLHPRKDILQIF